MIKRNKKQHGLSTFACRLTQTGFVPLYRRHWLVDSFVLFGAPYMAYDLYAMYLSHYHQQSLRDHSTAHHNHSLGTVTAFLSKERLLVLHHTALLLVFMPIVLVRNTLLNPLNYETQTVKCTRCVGPWIDRWINVWTG